MKSAVELLTKFDDVLAGLLGSWNDSEGLILVTSDHGNLEDLSTRRHTPSKVLGLMVGASSLRSAFASGLHDLTGIAPAIWRTLTTTKQD